MIHFSSYDIDWSIESVMQGMLMSWYIYHGIYLESPFKVAGRPQSLSTSNVGGAKYDFVYYTVLSVFKL